MVIDRRVQEENFVTKQLSSRTVRQEDVCNIGHEPFVKRLTDLE